MHRSVRVGRLYCCAMEEEAQPIIDHYRMLLLDKNTVKKFLNLESKMFGNYFFRMSDMIKIYMSPGKQHALVVTGIGKTNAAMVSAYAIEVLNPTDIINIGLCGSLRKDLKSSRILSLPCFAKRSAKNALSAEIEGLTLELEDLGCFFKDWNFEIQAHF